MDTSQGQDQSQRRQEDVDEDRAGGGKDRLRHGAEKVVQRPVAQVDEQAGTSAHYEHPTKADGAEGPHHRGGILGAHGALADGRGGRLEVERRREVIDSNLHDEGSPQVFLLAQEAVTGRQDVEASGGRPEEEPARESDPPAPRAWCSEITPVSRRCSAWGANRFDIAGDRQCVGRVEGAEESVADAAFDSEVRSLYRSADACESYGACAKNVIKHLTCRRRLRSDHGRGYIEQAFRRLAVRSDLLHGPENAPFLQRKDHRLLGTGCSNAQDGRRDMP
eukprot:CAMPEP_0182824034 /NCGR_PEP_ID=MMETSP0006_2-20121128/15076_1 /TAXON_ID=97485 /ORGANISM="Prymnesium parvum, Strain Texoma1" /LENGTH=277 /DNA_ID=CAMNT_0024951007 /DNA_START=450 /DNA_END=1279 /DNA_ORIENTATION=+